MNEIVYIIPSGRILLEHDSGSDLQFDFNHIYKLFPDCLPGQIRIWKTPEKPSRKWSRKINLDESGIPVDFNKTTDKITTLDKKENKEEVIKNQIVSLPIKNKENKPKLPLVVWRGPFYTATGYANMNREITRRLISKGMNLKIEAFPGINQVNSETSEFINTYSKKATDDPNIVVTGYVPMPCSENAAYNIFYTMIESTTAHPEFVKRCNESSKEVWIPNSDNARAMKEAGLCVPEYVIPLGVNTQRFSYGKVDVFNPYYKRVSDLTSCKPEGFRFLSIFRWAKSKGPDVLIKGFLKAFKDNESVHLVIFSHSKYAKCIQEQIIHYADGFYPKNIFLYNDVIPEEMMPSVYKSADCFVLPTRGEGMGLPILEAASMGLPVIASYNTAMMDFLSPETAYIIETDKLEDASDDLAMTTPYYRGQKFPVLGEKSINKLSEYMKTIYNNKDIALEKAKKLKDYVRNNLDWNDCADKIISRLNELLKGM